MEPYPDVVLPVVSLLEFLRRIGKSLQSKWERRNEPKENKRIQALPTASQDHGCCPSTQHPCLGVPAAPLCCTGKGAGGGIVGSTLEGCSRDGEPVFSCLLLPFLEQPSISRGIAAT